MQTEVISFFSDIDGKTYYSDHAKRLAFQLSSLNIPFDIRDKPSQGTYQKNCLSKPSFIYRMLVEKQKPVVWLDIDSDVRKGLDVFDHFANNSTDLVVSCSANKLHAAKASPIYLAFNSKVLEFLQHWMQISNQMANTGKWFDHETLIGLLHTFYQKEGFYMKFIGPEYCVWPGQENENSFIVMGLADVDSKKQALKDLGMNEELIAWQCPGTR
jgi:hypothetical protein